MPRGKRTAKNNKRKTADDDNGKDEPKLARTGSYNTQLRTAISEAVEEASSSGSSASAKLDIFFQAELELKDKVTTAHGDYACMLNQTDVINNNNKFYVIQMAKIRRGFAVFNRWGRVGETGQLSVSKFTSEEDAEKNFKKKFQDKTGNKWDDRANFKPKSKKYTLLVMDAEDDDEDTVDSKPTIKKEMVKIGDDLVSYPDSKLHQRTQLMVKVIFNKNMFEDQMAAMNLDVRKMPLGKLSKVQIAKGLEALIEIEEALKNNASDDEVATLTSKFFTLVPHDFGRQRPPILNSQDIIQQKKDVMLTLSDIELTQNLLPANVKVEQSNPLDDQYDSLKCDLDLLDKNSKEFKVISQYVTATKSYTNMKLVDVWCMDRHGAGRRFQLNDDIEVRKLLWHGTNVAVVAAIINSGLRIMPHSGGLVGRGIYFASEYSKSAGYACGHYGTFEGEKNVTFMFLSEVALGKMKEIKQSDGSIRKAPPGFNSVVARGQKEPNPRQDAVLEFDGRPVTVPVGKPVPQKAFKDSDFSQSEYLVYNEHQARLRFLLKFTS